MAQGHEFQQDRPGMELPDTLYSGPPPYAGRGASPSELGRGAPDTAENKLGSPWNVLLRGIQRKGEVVAQYATVGTSPVLVRPSEERMYLIIQNTSLAATLYVGVGYPPTTLNGLILAANGGAYEPSVIPQGDIWLLASGAATNYVLLYAVG